MLFCIARRSCIRYLEWFGGARLARSDVRPPDPRHFTPGSPIIHLTHLNHLLHSFPQLNLPCWSLSRHLCNPGCRYTMRRAGVRPHHGMWVRQAGLAVDAPFRSPLFRKAATVHPNGLPAASSENGLGHAVSAFEAVTALLPLMAPSSGESRVERCDQTKRSFRFHRSSPLCCSFQLTLPRKFLSFTVQVPSAFSNQSLICTPSPVSNPQLRLSRALWLKPPAVGHG